MIQKESMLKSEFGHYKENAEFEKEEFECKLREYEDQKIEYEYKKSKETAKLRLEKIEWVDKCKIVHDRVLILRKERDALLKGFNLNKY
jgi:hypothetical protein